MPFRPLLTLTALLVPLALAADRPARGDYQFAVIASFGTTSSGGAPRAAVTLDAQGNLFGTTLLGGSGAGGTVYEIAAGTNQIRDVASFTTATGINSFYGMTVDAAGNLYGTTAGDFGVTGSVFRVAAGTGTITPLVAFNSASGGGSSSGVIRDAQGNLYGTTMAANNAGGTIYRVAAGTNAVTTVATFTGTAPAGGLTMDSQGNLYGSTRGPNGQGTVFRVAAGTGLATTLTNFGGDTGLYPGQLTADAAGNLYGITQSDGANGTGEIFRIAAGTNAFSVVASLGAIGFNPKSDLAIDSHGNLFFSSYGSSGFGSPYGSIYELIAGTSTIVDLHDFHGADGFNPFSPLTIDSHDNLYGTTYRGGSNGGGVVFELLNPATVPEPASILAAAQACGLALAGAAWARRRWNGGTAQVAPPR